MLRGTDRLSGLLEPDSIAKFLEPHLSIDQFLAQSPLDTGLSFGALYLQIRPE